MSFTNPDTWTVVISGLLYVGAIAWLVARGQPVRVGLVMLLASVLPLIGQALFDHVEEGEFIMPGFAFLAMIAAPPALLVVAGGLIAAVIRVFRRTRHSRLPVQRM